VLENIIDENGQYPPELLLDLVKALRIRNAALKACMAPATRIIFSAINVGSYRVEEVIQAQRDQLAVEKSLPNQSRVSKKSRKTESGGESHEKIWTLQ
jgi:hypothetical protein